MKIQYARIIPLQVIQTLTQPKDGPTTAEENITTGVSTGHDFPERTNLSRKDVCFSSTFSFTLINH